MPIETWDNLEITQAVAILAATVKDHGILMLDFLADEDSDLVMALVEKRLETPQALAPGIWSYEQKTGETIHTDWDGVQRRLTLAEHADFAAAIADWHERVEANFLIFHAAEILLGPSWQLP